MSVTLDATGTWNMWPLASGQPEQGPQGTNQTNWGYQGCSDCCPRSEYNLGTLIGQVGTSNNFFAVGTLLTFTPWDTGRLYLLANDYTAASDCGDYYYDNSGFVNVRLTVTYNFQVSAAAKINTGINLLPGDYIAISVPNNGQNWWVWTYNGYSGGPDPKGNGPPLTCPAPAPNVPAGALIGQIGTGPYFYIGWSVQFTATVAGTLNMAMQGCLSDYDTYAGYVSVSVKLIRAPNCIW
jgi:hypothetical protein